MLALHPSGPLSLHSVPTRRSSDLKLDGASSQLTDNAGISIGTGTIIGLGKVTGAITATGAAHITERDGTRLNSTHITNTCSLTLTIARASDTLLLDAASTASGLSF